MPRSRNRSITLRKSEIEFIKQYLKQNEDQRLKEGKPMSIVSVLREGLMLWAEQKGLTDDLLKALKQSE